MRDSEIFVSKVILLYCLLRISLACLLRVGFTCLRCLMVHERTLLPLSAPPRCFCIAARRRIVGSKSEYGDSIASSSGDRKGLHFCDEGSWWESGDVYFARCVLFILYGDGDYLLTYLPT